LRSPLVIGGRLYLSLGEAGTAFDAATGAVLWQSAPGHPGYSSPVPFLADGVLRLAFFSGRGVVGVDAATGRTCWDIPWRTEWDMNAADPIIDGGRLFVSAGNNAGCALYDLTVSPPREVWRNKNLKTADGLSRPLRRMDSARSRRGGRWRGAVGRRLRWREVVSMCAMRRATLFACLRFCRLVDDRAWQTR